LNVGEHDALFVEVSQALLGSRPGRDEKPSYLHQLQKQGVFLIDMKLDPDDGTGLKGHATSLVWRCRRLHPMQVVLISTGVFDAAYAALEEASLPVVRERIDFPGSGRQKDFRRGFANALKRIGWVFTGGN
jgi:hypothetical protein